MRGYVPYKWKRQKKRTGRQRKSGRKLVTAGRLRKREKTAERVLTAEEKTREGGDG